MKSLFSLLLLCLSCQKTPETPTPVNPGTPELRPELTGKLLYHTYTCYECNDSKLYLVDFAAKTRTLLSEHWNIANPMNAHFSPDGKKIVFMGIDPGTATWDVYLWRLDSPDQPVNLTKALGNTRDEDPKFSPDGARIVIKHNGQLAEIDTNGLIINAIQLPEEASMPYYSTDGKTILYSANSGANADIYSINTDGSGKRALAAVPGSQEYYPIVRDSATFFYTRWLSPETGFDQLYLGYFAANKAPLWLPLNKENADYSDAYPCGAQYVILSSTKSGSYGGYDLYIANINTGNIWTLSNYLSAINSTKQELGACYFGK